MTAIYEGVMGVQTPRLELVPASVNNAYEAAADLAASYGTVPLKWQLYALKVLMGERPDGTWAARQAGLSVARQNGKNTVLEIRELYGLVVRGEKIIHTAHEVKTANDHFRRMKEYFENPRFPDLRKMVTKVVNKNGEEGIYLNNGGVIRFMARSKSSGRGFQADLLVLDEAQELDDDKLAAIQAVLTTSEHPQMILTGTPPGPSIAADVFPRMRDRALEGLDTSLAWMEWSADKHSDLDDPYTWAQANPGLGTLVQGETISGFRGTASDEVFGREQCGMWDGVAATTVVDMDHWSTLVNTITPEDPVVFAIDVAPNRSTATISMAGYLGENIHTEAVRAFKGTSRLVDEMKKLCDAWGPVAVGVDKDEPLLLDLKRAGVPVYALDGPDVAKAWGQFMDRVNQGTLLHADQDALNGALLMATTRPVLSGYAWQRKNPNGDITPLVACTNAAYVLTLKRNPRKPVGPKKKQRMLVM